VKFSELISKVSKITEYEEDEISFILKSTIAIISYCLLSNEEVKISGLGTFIWQHRRQSRRRHPVSGESVNVSEKWILRFRPVKKLRFLDAEERFKNG